MKKNPKRIVRITIPNWKSSLGLNSIHIFRISYKDYNPLSNVTTSRCSNAFPLSNSPVQVYPEFRAAMRQSSSSTDTPNGRLRQDFRNLGTNLCFDKSGDSGRTMIPT